MNDKPRVLYIEDDPGIARLIEIKLLKEGYGFELATDGISGIEKFRNQSFNVIMIDQTLPDMTGIDLIREFSMTPDCPPLIMITGNADTETVLDAMRSGASDYIMKDIELRFIDLLPMVILKTISHHHAIKERIKSEIEKRKSDEKFTSLTDQIHEGVWSIDSNFYTVSVNKRIAEWLGSDEESLRSQQILTFIEAGSISRFISLLDNWPDPDIRECDLVLKSTTDESIEVHARGKAIRDDLGHIVGFILTFTDRREQIRKDKQLHEQSKKYQHLIEQVSDFIWETDAQGRLTFANDRCKDLLGYVPDEMTGKEFCRLSVTEEANQTESFFRALPGNRDPVFAKLLTVFHKNGQRIILESNLTPMFEESGIWTGYRGISRDITKKIEFESRLKRDKDIESAFSELSQILIHSSPSEEDIAKIILHYGLKMTMSRHGFVSVIDKKTGDVISHTLTDMMGKDCDLTGEHRRIVFPRKPDGTYPALWGFAINERKGFFTNDPQSHSASIGLPAGHIPLTSYLAVPAIFSDEVLGLIAFSNADQFHPEDLAVAERLADMYATTLFRAERERMLIQHQDQMKNIIHSMVDAFALHEIITDEAGKPINYRFLEVNPAFEKMTGLKSETVIGKTVLEILPEIEKYWIENYGRVALTGEPYQFENYSKELGKHFLVTAYSPDKNRFACIFQDVSILRTAEEAIRISEEKYRNLFNNSAVAVSVTTTGGNYIEFNDTYRKMLGYTKDELEQFNTADITHPEDRPISDYHMSLVAEGQSEMQRYEKRYIHKNGSIVWGDVCIKPLKDHSGAITGIIGSVIDITQQKKNIDELQIKDFALHSSQSGIAFADMNGMIFYANQSFIRLWGYDTQGEVLGRHISEFACSKEQVREVEETIRRGGMYAGEGLSEKKDGSLFRVQLNANMVVSPDRKPVCMMASFVDITEHKRKDDLFQLRYRLLQYADTHTLEELLRKTLDEAEEMTGSRIGFYHFVEPDQKTLSLQAWSTRTLNEFCKAEGKGLHYSIEKAGVWTDCVRKGCAVIHNDYAGLPDKKGLPDGHTALIRELVVPIYRKGRIVAILGVGNKPQDYTELDSEVITFIADVAWDITERKRTEEALRESEEQYRKLAEDMPVYICTFLPDGTLQYVNDYLAELTGMKPDDLRGKNFYEFLHESDRHNTFGRLQSLSPECPVETHEQGYVNLTGDVCYQQWTNRAFFDEDNRLVYIQALGQDITDRKRAEKELRESLQTSADIIQEIPSGFFIYEFEPPDRLILLDANPESERLTGIRIDEWRGREFNELWPEAKKSGITALFLNAMQTGIPYETEDLYYQDNRLSGAFRIRAFALPGKKLAVAFEDITERKKAEKALRESQTQLSLITDNVPFLMAHISRDLRYLYVNAVYASRYGLSKEEIVGRHASEVIGEESFMVARPHYDRVLQGQTAVFERTVKNGNDSEVIFNCFFIPNRDEDGNVDSFFALFEDITAKKTAENERFERLKRIASQNKTLADISSLTIESNRDRPEMMKKVTRLAGMCLQTACTSIWMGTAAQGYIECLDLYDLADQKHTRGKRLYMKDYPDYFECLTQNRYISVSDAVNDPRISEFSLQYTKPAGITAMLDVPLRISGQLFGVLCFEHIGPERNWFDDEIRFATEAADQLITILLNLERLDAAETLKISEQRFRALYENSLDAIVVADENGNYVSVNDAACRLFKINPADFLRRNVRDLIKPDGRSAEQDYRDFVMAGKDHGEFSFRRPDGEIRITEYTAFQLNEKLFVSILRDVTDRKKYEREIRESEEKFASLFRGSPDMIGITDFVSGRFIDVNDAFCRETGYTREEIIHRTSVELGIWIDPANWRDFIHTLQMKGFIRDEEMNFRMKSGELKTFLVSGEIVSLHNEKLIFSFLKNITERKKAELQLIHYASELEMFNDEARQYANIITHDLRSPLVNMIGFARELNGQLRSLTEQINGVIQQLEPVKSNAVRSVLFEEMPESVTIIEKSAIRMNSMVDALLKFSRIGRRDLEWKPVDLNIILQRIVDTLSFQIREKNIMMDIPPLPVIIADPFAADQILGNILNNAVQYLHPGREGKISVRADIKDNEIIISVADNGIGIRPEDEHKVFAPFRRGRHAHIPGEGMGMAYVRTLVRKLGGSIYFKSVPEEGTVFYIHLPRKDMNQQPETQG